MKSLPHLQVVVSKGRCYAYYRKGRFRCPITTPDGGRLAYVEPPSRDFLDAYHRIHAGIGVPTAPAAGSLAALIAAYRASRQYARLAPSTQCDYARYLNLLQPFGHLAVATMPPKFVTDLQTHFEERPVKANYLVRVLRLLMAWGRRNGWRRDNPAEAITPIPTDGRHRPWEEGEIAAFRACWPASTPQRVAFELMLNTAQRGGDVIALRRANLQGGCVRLCQAKTRAVVELPLAPTLAAVLLPWLEGHQSNYLLVTSHGRPFTPDYFRHLMRSAYTAAGLPSSCTNHGLRYTAATRLREAGCPPDVIAAITGHRTEAMVRKYSEQRRLAAVAIRALVCWEDGA